MTRSVYVPGYMDRELGELDLLGHDRNYLVMTNGLFSNAAVYERLPTLVPHTRIVMCR